MDDDFLRLFPGLTVHVLLGLGVVLDQLRQKADVADSQPQRVHLRQPLLVRQCRDVSPQPFERVVDGLHAAPFPQVSGLALHDLLLDAFSLSFSHFPYVFLVGIWRTELRVAVVRTFRARQLIGSKVKTG